jgi:hypothetical protein
MPGSSSNRYTAGRLVRRSAAGWVSGSNFSSMVVAPIVFDILWGLSRQGKAPVPKQVPVLPFYPPAVGHGDYSFPTVRQFTHTAERAMPINSTQEAASEAQSFLPFNALKVRKRLSPFGELLKNGTFCRLAIPGLTLVDVPAEPQLSNGLAASPRGRREGTTTCLIAA